MVGVMLLIKLKFGQLVQMDFRGGVAKGGKFIVTSESSEVLTDYFEGLLLCPFVHGLKLLILDTFIEFKSHNNRHIAFCNM